MNNSIRSKTFKSIFSLAIGPVLIIGILISLQNISDQNQKSLEILHLNADKIVTEANSFFQNIEENLNIMVVFGAIHNTPDEKLNAVLGTLLYHQSQFEEISFLSNSYQVLANRHRYKPTPHPTHPDFIRTELQHHPDIQYGTVHFQEETGEPLMHYYMKPVNPLTGKVLGTLAIDIRLKKIWTLIQKASTNRINNIYLTDSNGYILAHRNSSIVLRRTQIKIPESDGIQKNHEDNYVMATVKQVELGNTHFFVIAETPITTVLKSTIFTALTTMILLIVSLILAVILILLARKNIIAPIEDLSQTVDQFAQGDFSANATVFTEDEIGNLAKSFNNMAGKLNQTLSNLQKEIQIRKDAETNLSRLNEKLEDIVLERTSELEHSNKALQDSLETLQRTRNQLIHQEKMASLGVLTAGIAHEIKNPLNFIINYAETATEITDEIKELTRQLSLDKEHDELIKELVKATDIIVKHSNRANRIIDNMLMHSRESSQSFSLTNINRLLLEYVNISFHGKKINHQNIQLQYSTDLDESIKEIELNQQDISRVFLNLVNNAFDAVIEKAKSHQNSGYTPEVLIKSRNLEPHIEISIIDNGTGIEEDKLEKIFMPFYTSKPPGEGTGLGLSICYDIIVLEHSGKIEAQSIAGESTTMTLQLPKIKNSIN